MSIPTSNTSPQGQTGTSEENPTYTEEGTSEGDKIIAGIVAAYAATVWIKYYDEMQDGMDKLEGFLLRQKDIADCFFDMYTEITCANQRAAYSKIAQTVIPGMSCETALEIWKTRAQEEFVNIQQMSLHWRRRYCLPELPACDHEMELTRTTVAINAAEQDRRFTERRAESIRELRLNGLQRVSVSMNVNPGPVFDFLNTATGLQQGLINGAAGIAQGAGSAFGSLLGYSLS